MKYYNWRPLKRSLCNKCTIYYLLWRKRKKSIEIWALLCDIHMSLLFVHTTTAVLIICMCLLLIQSLEWSIIRIPYVSRKDIATFFVRLLLKCKCLWLSFVSRILLEKNSQLISDRIVNLKMTNKKRKKTAKNGTQSRL